MEVKDKYIKTEVGLLPREWVSDKLNKFWDVTDCKHLTALFVENGIPVVSIQDVQSRYVSFENSKKTTEYYYKKLIEGGRKPIAGDLIFSRNATVGEVAQVPEIHFPFALGQDVCLLRKKNKNFSSDYFQSILKSPIVTRQLENVMVGSTFKRVNIEQIKNFYVPMPPILEQTAIATALSDTDALISSLEKLIAKKRNIKKGVMQELLEPKKGWEVKRLGEIGKVYGGLSGKSKSDFNDGNSLFIPFMNIMSNPIIDVNYLGFVKIGNGESQNKALKGDLFFNGSSETPEEVGMCSVLLEDKPNLYLNSFCFGYRLNKDSNADGLFMAYFLRSSYGRNLFYSMAQGATRYNLSKVNFNKLEIQLPSEIEQYNISKIIFDLDSEIMALESKLSKYRQIKSGMMQNLLTGKIRLV